MTKEPGKPANYGKMFVFWNCAGKAGKAYTIYKTLLAIPGKKLDFPLKDPHN